jgi:hypothetical protein
MNDAICLIACAEEKARGAGLSRSSGGGEAKSLAVSKGFIGENASFGSQMRVRLLRVGSYFLA